MTIRKDERGFSLGEEYDFNVRQIQRALRILHKNGWDIPKVFEDGIFGEETERAVIAFQKENGLPPDGIVGKRTWELLMEKANEVLSENAEPFPIFPYVSDEESAVLPEEEGRAIYFLQAMLIAVAEKFSGFDGVVLNGKNDEATRAAIKKLRKYEEDEEPDGRLDRKSWNAVARLFNAI